MISSIIQALFIQIQPNMSEQEKKRQRIYYLLNTDTKPKKIIRVSLRPPSSPDLKPHRLNYTILFFTKKSNAASDPNIGSLKTAIEEEWNKMSEEFILKECKSFRSRVDTITEKMAAIWSKLTVLCLSCFLLLIFLNQN